MERRSCLKGAVQTSCQYERGTRGRCATAVACISNIHLILALCTPPLNALCGCPRRGSIKPGSQQPAVGRRMACAAPPHSQDIFMSTLTPGDYPSRTDAFSFPHELTRPFWVIAVDWDSTVGAARQGIYALSRRSWRRCSDWASASPSSPVPISPPSTGSSRPLSRHAQAPPVHPDQSGLRGLRLRPPIPSCPAPAPAGYRRENRPLTGVAEACISSDMKPIEEGLTDNADAIAWVVRELAQQRHLPQAHPDRQRRVRLPGRDREPRSADADPAQPRRGGRVRGARSSRGVRGRDPSRRRSVPFSSPPERANR